MLPQAIHDALMHYTGGHVNEARLERGRAVYHVVAVAGDRERRRLVATEYRYIRPDEAARYTARGWRVYLIVASGYKPFAARDIRVRDIPPSEADEWEIVQEY